MIWRPRKWRAVRLSVAALMVLLSLRVAAFARLVGFACTMLLWWHDVVLAKLACWGIAKTPKAFEWEIGSICVRPSFRSRRQSEIVVYDWKWLNPSGFEKTPYMLRVERLMFTVDLWQAVQAVLRKEGVPVGLIHLHGVEFNAERNVLDALNLWVALDIPDQDVNAVVRHVRDSLSVKEYDDVDPVDDVEPSANTAAAAADPTPRRRGRDPGRGGAARCETTAKDGLEPASVPRDDEPTSPPPPPRKKTHGWTCGIGWKKQRRTRGASGKEGKKLESNARETAKSEETGSSFSSDNPNPNSSGSSADARTRRRSKLFGAMKRASLMLGGGTKSPQAPAAASGDSTTPQRPRLARADTDLDDPRRRPRWGVPQLFSVERVVCTRIKVRVLDLLLVRSHRAASSFGDGTIKIEHVDVTRATLESPDPARRRRGVYLGELVWGLIHVLVKKIVKTKPSRLVKHSTLAVAFAVSDLAHYAVARTLEMAVNAPPTASRALFSEGKARGDKKENACGLRLRLLRGRRLVVHDAAAGKAYVSTQVRVVLRTRSRAVDAGSAGDPDATLRAANEDLTTRPSSGGDDEAPFEEGEFSVSGVAAASGGGRSEASGGASERPSVVDSAKSSVKMWTRGPSWNETFDLGPVTDLRTAELVVMACHSDSPWSPSQSKLAVGEVVVPLVSVFSSAAIARRRGNKTTEIVAWFHLALPTDASMQLVDSWGNSHSVHPAKRRSGYRLFSRCEDDDDVVDDDDDPEGAGTQTRRRTSSSRFRAAATHSVDFLENRFATYSGHHDRTVSLLLGEVKIGIQLTNLDQCAGLLRPELPQKSRSRLFSLRSRASLGASPSNSDARQPPTPPG